MIMDFDAQGISNTAWVFSKIRLHAELTLKIPLKAPGGGTAASHTLARPLGLYMHQLYAHIDALTGGDRWWED